MNELNSGFRGMILPREGGHIRQKRKEVSLTMLRAESNRLHSIKKCETLSSALPQAQKVEGASYIKFNLAQIEYHAIF